MQFDEIKRGLEGVVFAELRNEGENYFEAVLVRDELAKLTAGLERLFGPAVWPSDNKLIPQAQEAVKEFGGIRQGQVLYFWNDGKDIIFAMLWPWQDGYRTTLKIIGKIS